MRRKVCRCPIKRALLASQDILCKRDIVRRRLAQLFFLRFYNTLPRLLGTGQHEAITSQLLELINPAPKIALE